MGCSASRPETLQATPIEEPSYSFSSQNSLISSPSSTNWASFVHHPAIHKGDSNHLVSLTSTTYGSLVLAGNHPSTTMYGGYGGDSSPDSVINTWELMEGLEDNGFDHGLGDDVKIESLSFCDFNKIPTLRFGLNFDQSVEKLSDSYVYVEMPKRNFEGEELNSKPLWKLLSEESLLSKMDPNVGVSYHKSLSSSKLGYDASKTSTTTIQYGLAGMDYEESKIYGALSESLDNREGINASSTTTTTIGYGLTGIGSRECKTDAALPLSLDNEGYNTSSTTIIPYGLTEVGSEDNKMYALLPQSIDDRDDCNASSVMNESMGSSPLVEKCKVLNSKLDGVDKDDGLASCEDKIVLYFTSLRGIRKTYEDCCMVRLILKGFRVIVDEKDISMDSSYRQELQSALDGKALSLPQLFIRGKCVGGGDEIKHLHEIGELERLLDGFPVLDCGFVCDNCGDVRFIPCSGCCGSRKLFLEDEGQTIRCPDCNENGLVRCSACCS